MTTDTESPAEIRPPPRPRPENPVLAGLIEPFGDAEWVLSNGDDVVRLPRERLADLAAAARRVGFETCADVTVVDYLRRSSGRFDVVANLLSLQHRLRLRILVAVSNDDPACPSLVSIYPGANFFEREAFDMFGIRFEGHPDLTRILMPDDWEGHPLRKDYGVGSVPVQFKESHQVS